MLATMTTMALLTPALAEDFHPIWMRWEKAFTADTPADTAFTVTFTAPSGKTSTVDGFHDGNRTWRVRFLPGETGQWSYRTQSKPPVRGLDGESGKFRTRGPAEAESNRFRRSGAIRVAEVGTYLEHADGTPFFWLGDTVWSGPLRAKKDDWDRFLDDRVAKKFSVIQFVLTAPWRVDPANSKGKTANRIDKNKLHINPDFFKVLDERIDAINAKGLLAAPVLLWTLGKKEASPGQLPEEDCIKLARYCVARYQGHHVAWILPGDGNYSGKNGERWKRIGRAVFDRPGHAPTLMHPQGMHWPFEEFREEKWLSLFGYQSGHGDDGPTLTWIHSGLAARNWKKKPTKPILNLEPPYEDHNAYQSRKPHSAYNVRRACYWSLLNAPACGLTYGAHGVWSWQEKAGVPADHGGTGVAKPWRQAMQLPGSTHVKHLAELFGSIAWWTLRPDPELLQGQPGGKDPAKFVAAASSEQGEVSVLYLPVGGEIKLKKPHPEGFGVAWFNPRDGKLRKVRDEDRKTYRAPDGQDWVLLIIRP
jgi:hypothetical protein